MGSISLSSIQHELLLLTETFAPFQVSFIFTVELAEVLKRELQLTCRHSGVCFTEREEDQGDRLR